MCITGLVVPTGAAMWFVRRMVLREERRRLEATARMPDVALTRESTGLSISRRSGKRADRRNPKSPPYKLIR
jgi:hypothetical protein